MIDFRLISRLPDRMTLHPVSVRFRLISRLPDRMTLHPVSVRQPSGKKSTERIRMMEAIQLDLFDFAAMQTAVQSKERNIQRLGRFDRGFHGGQPPLSDAQRAAFR